jgi:hypothetical protein
VIIYRAGMEQGAIMTDKIDRVTVATEHLRKGVLPPANLDLPMPSGAAVPPGAGSESGGDGDQGGAGQSGGSRRSSG